MNSRSSRVSIPSGVRDMICSILEITPNHSEEEVYTMLQECSMDPSETVSKLLLLDTFHVVKRRGTKKREINREPSDSRRRLGMPGRGGRGGRGEYSSRYVANDAGSGRNVNARKEYPVHQDTEEKGNASSSLTNTLYVEVKPSAITSSSAPGLANGPTKVILPVPSRESTSQESHVNNITLKEFNALRKTDKTMATQLNSADVKSGSECGQSAPSSNQLPSVTPPSVSGVYTSALDPVLDLSLDAWLLGSAGTIRREVGSQRAVIEATVNKGGASSDVPASEGSSVSKKESSDMSDSQLHGKMFSKPQELRTTQPSDRSAVASSLTGSTGSRPSSNYSSRPQQLSVFQKAFGPSKEWKPKSTQANSAQASGMLDASIVEPHTVHAVVHSLPAISSTGAEATSMKFQKKLEELRISDTLQVIIPHHLQVPESERHGLSFGSFDSNFKLSLDFENDPACNKSSSPPSESSQDIEDPSSSIRHASLSSREADCSDQRQSATQMTENVSSREADMSSSISAVPEYGQSEGGSAVVSEDPQSSFVYTAPNYSTFGLVPPVLGSHFAPPESTESQARDASRLPSFVFQQPFDPATSYYTQLYRAAADGDGRFSPFLAPGAAKYNGNVAVLPAQTGQTQQETANSLSLSLAGPTTLTTQAAGVMQSSIPVTQQTVPVFRQPAGVHMSHYPPNYLPYSPYFSPFYVPQPPLHHFLSNTAFPQQPPTGSMYPPPAAAAAVAPVKYPISQYKTGANTSNSNHIGMPTGYGTYTSTPPGYSPSSAVTSGNSNGNEDLPLSQFAGQQSEGSAVWISMPGREMSTVQPNSFYHLPPQGQHMAFGPTQANHSNFTGIFHPSQTVTAAAVHPLLQQSQAMAGAVEMVGPPAGVYQQPQRAQISWANSY